MTPTLLLTPVEIADSLIAEIRGSPLEEEWRRNDVMKVVVDYNRVMSLLRELRRRLEEDNCR